MMCDFMLLLIFGALCVSVVYEMHATPRIVSELTRLRDELRKGSE